MVYYQLAFLGSPPPSLETELIAKLSSAIATLGMNLGDEVTLHSGDAEFAPVQKLTSAALYFGVQGKVEHTSLAALKRSGVPIVPVASKTGNFNKEIPESLHAINGISLEDTNADRLITILLECAGLLPRQRRVFVSYKREESRAVALQLFEALSARRFDVFLDTHGIAEGEDFQEQLWHKLSDCDVLLMLDTPNYFNSRWTRAELARSQVKSVGVLRIGWPGHPLDKRASLARNLQLSDSDFTADAILSGATVKNVCIELESTRTTSIATRYRNLVSSVAGGLEIIGGSLQGVGIKRRMVLNLPDGRRAIAVPILGIPNSTTMQDALVDGHDSPIAIVFNHFGLQGQWMEHMDWLGKHITSVRWVKEHDAPWIFADWEG